MCLSIEASVLGALTGYTGSAICWFRNEGADRGRAMYFLLHGTWQALDAYLWYDMDSKGNVCSEMNFYISSHILPGIICLLLMFQMLFGQMILHFAGKKVYWNNWQVFKLTSGLAICWFMLYDEFSTSRCTVILDMPTMISSRLLEWCNQAFSYKALFAYGFTAVAGYDDPTEESKTKALTQSWIVYIAICVVLAQAFFFGSFHLSLFCFFCFGMIVPAIWGPRKIIRTCNTCW